MSLQIQIARRKYAQKPTDLPAATLASKARMWRMDALHASRESSRPRKPLDLRYIRIIRVLRKLATLKAGPCTNDWRSSLQAMFSRFFL